MSERSDEQVDLARRLLEAEQSLDGSVRAGESAAFRVYDALVEALAPLIGAAGVAAVFARSAKLTADDFPPFREALSTVEAADPSARARMALSALAPDAAAAAAALLLAHFLALLTAFIGEGLLARVLRRALPAFESTVTKEIDR